METTEQGQPTAAMLMQQASEQLAGLMASLMEQSEQLRERERVSESLAAELVQRRAKIEQDQESLLRLQGAVSALQQLNGGSNDAG